MNKSPVRPQTPPPLAGAGDRLDLMQTFVRIVEAGSLSRAAAQMQTTQPTISRRLQTLERLLGLRLLQRSTRAMHLTEDGERCYEHAKALIDQWEALQSDVRGDHDTPRGHLRVAVPHAFGQEQLVRPMTEFLLRYPDVQVEWLLRDDVRDFIGAGIDCAIQVGEVRDPSVVAIRLMDVPRIVIASPRLWPADTPPPPVDELPDLPWLALSTYYRSEVVLAHPQTRHTRRFAIHPRLSTDNLYVLCNAAIFGLGAGIASAWMVAEALSDGRLVHLAPPWQAPSLPVYLVYPHARFYPPRLRRFIDAMRAAMPVAGGVTA